MSDCARECGCAGGDEPCERCRADAVRVAEAAAEAWERAGAAAVNEIDHEDPARGRVFRLRRDPSGCFRVVDARPMGSIERARCRPAPARA